ncbi:cytochrome c oxidase subunit 3 [Marinicella sediminis]|uniref:cytochrome-c oxidase n=1 Tax=Marinicella sediminis TaxID=1792834 RepID=A0ABV7J457_9GAMM|nr:cytochrome c oxidase subunit 3 [Marinicella sediminis]
MSEASKDQYYVPHLAKWPIVGSVGLTVTVLGAINLLNSENPGTPWMLYLGFAIILLMMFGWFGEVIKESEDNLYNTQVDTSFRMGMIWFIFSEVMFFGAFFGALFYARTFSVPWLGGEGTGLSTNEVLWNGYEGVWPTNGPGDLGGRFELIDPYHLPLINTLLLLASSVTITIAHHALRANNRSQTIIWLIATVILGAVFLFYQAEEYIEAYRDLNLTLSSGIYGSTFFMLTGFHGMHVTLGAIMITIITIRVIRGHFRPESHFGFEAVAWYWHFVDVVWLGLFIFVYIL